MSALAAHNDVLAVLTYDPFGIKLPGEPGLEVTDGENVIAVPETGAFQDGYEELFVEKLNNIRAVLRSIRIPVLPICTHEPVTEQVLNALGSHR